MNFHFSKHVHEELEKRKIALALIEQVLRAPEQQMPEVDDITCFQSKVSIDGRPYLLRVMVDKTVTPPVVVTVIAPVRSANIGGWHESEI